MEEELILELPERKRKARRSVEVAVVVPSLEPDYTYMELLERVYQHEPVTPVLPKFALPLPQLMRRGNRTLLVSFAALCRQMNRTTDHLQRFVAAELQAETSVDGNQALVLRCKVLPARMTALLRQYCALYVHMSPVVMRAHPNVISLVV